MVEWQNILWMMEWLLNDRMMVEWRNEDRMAVIKIELTERNFQNQGFLLVESSKLRPLIGREDPPKKSKGLTLIWKCPSFLRHSLILTSFLGQFYHSGMRISGLEWWDDAEITWMSLGWAHSIVMPPFQCHPIIQVTFHHSKYSKQGGLTMIRMTGEWWDELGLNRMTKGWNLNGSWKSGQPTPSAEGGG